MKQSQATEAKLEIFLYNDKRLYEQLIENWN